MDKSLEWQQIYGAKERERKSLPSRMDWRSNPRIKSSDLRGMWAGGFDGGAAAALCPESGEGEELPGRAGPMRLNTDCAAPKS